MKITPIDNKRVKIEVDEGKILVCILNDQRYSEAIVDKKKIKNFKEVSE